MAVVKYRVDGRKSRNYCSTATIVVFAALCLLGVWMLTSSSVVPVQNSVVPSPKTKTEIKEKISEEDSKPFEDSSGDLTEDATNGDDSSKNDEDENRADETSKNNPEKENTETKAENENDEETKTEKPDSDGETNSGKIEKSLEGEEENIVDVKHEDDGKTEEKIEKKLESQEKEGDSSDILPAGAQSEILQEVTTQNGTWSTQASESENEKKKQKSLSSNEHKWKVCKVTAGPDYIPCLDNVKVVRKLPSSSHYEHRERHCLDEAPTCLVSLPDGYKRSIKWPKSREKIWYSNVPHSKLAAVKGHQNWVKVSGDYLTFPGGGTQFKNGALHYIDFLQNSLPKLEWGKRTRVILDVGCGVASFGGYLFERDVLAMSFAPKDEHEAQVQFALERGVPALLSVMGTKRLPYPSKAFDAIHCARCRVPWHIEGGKLLLELNRLLRPGGYFVWSATPVYRKDPENSGIWTAMSELTKSMCWDLVAVKKDKVNDVGAAFYRKPTSNECYEKRTKNEPPLCKDSDDPDAAWNVPLDACIHKVPVSSKERASKWPEEWPLRGEKAPIWLKSSQVGVYGKAGPEDFVEDYKHWKHVVSNSYVNGMGISWSSVRNVMDMKAVYGGFAAALKDLNVWVMNVVPINSPDTLPLIYDRGFFGIYHDWCESFSTYPRTYDLLHADHLFSDIKKRCKILPVFAEVDRILRPEGHLIVRDKIDIISEIESLAKSLQWKIRLTYSKDNEGLLCIQKSFWRPTEEEIIASSIE